MVKGPTTIAKSAWCESSESRYEVGSSHPLVTTSSLQSGGVPTWPTRFHCCKVALEVDKPSGSTYLLTKSGFGNRIHLPMSLYQLCSLVICTPISSCHPKGNKLYKPVMVQTHDLSNYEGCVLPVCYSHVRKVPLLHLRS